jgi:hypothetical protein
MCILMLVLYAFIDMNILNMQEKAKAEAEAAKVALQVAQVCT